MSLTPSQFRYGFGNQLSAEESSELFDRWAIPSPGKPLFEDAVANFTRTSPAAVDTRNKDRGPLLLIGRGPRPYGTGGDHHGHPEALPQVPGHHGLPGVPGPGPLAHDRSRVARGRPGVPGLAQAAPRVAGPEPVPVRVVWRQFDRLHVTPPATQAPGTDGGNAERVPAPDAPAPDVPGLDPRGAVSAPRRVG